MGKLQPDLALRVELCMNAVLGTGFEKTRPLTFGAFPRETSDPYRGSPRRTPREKTPRQVGPKLATGR